MQQNEAGDNVTFSPRAGHGHYEPLHYPDFEYSVLNGTGIHEDALVFSAHCHSGCQSWPEGYMDVSSHNAPASYALGPREDFKSDDPAAPIKVHAEFGSFEIDMRRTYGKHDSPSLSEGSENAGVEAGGSKKGMTDAKSTAHAVLMVLVFVVVLPVGALMPRFANAVKTHAVMQGLSLVGGLVGFGMGVSCSFYYQRVGSFAFSVFPFFHRVRITDNP